MIELFNDIECTMRRLGCSCWCHKYILYLLNVYSTKRADRSQFKFEEIKNTKFKNNNINVNE